MRIAIALLLLCAAVPCRLFAADGGYLENSLHEERQPAKPVELAAPLARTLTALVVVIALIFVCARFAGKFMAGTRAGGHAKLIRVVESEFLAPKNRLMIVDAAGELMLLSLDPAGTRFLARLDSPQAREAVDNAREKPAGNFGSVMSKFVKGYETKGAAPRENEISEGIRDIHAEIEKLKAMRNDINA